MSQVVVNTTLDMDNVGKIVNLPNPSSNKDAATKEYVDLVASGGAPATFKTAEIDLGSTPVRKKTISVTDALVTPSTKINVWQAGIAATGRTVDENEMDQLHFVAVAKTGTFDIYVTCLSGTVSGKYVIGYQLG